MNKLALALTISLLSVVPAAASGSCADQFAGGVKPTGSFSSSTTLCYRKFAILYSGVRKTPIWSAERLTRERVQRASQLRRPTNGPFHTEENVPAHQRSMLADYHSGARTYDRGHMAPSGDMPDQESQFNSFVLSNVVPQAACVNELVWEGVESTVRYLAEQDGEIFVVTGPIYTHKPKTIGRDHVAVPNRVWKAVYDPRMGASVVYLARNYNAAGSDYKMISVKGLKSLTGIDPFPAVPANQKDTVGPFPVPDAPHFSCRLDR